MNKRKTRRASWGWLTKEHGTLFLVLLIILAFPVGLYVMWTDECRWNRFVKAAVSLAWLAVIVCAITLLPSVSQYQSVGSVEIVSKKNNLAMLGPGRPENIPETAQVIKSVSEASSLISQPTPTPDPVMVYCNDNGLYYHLAGCRYVYSTTPRVRLMAALQAGKTACPTCNPPNEMTY